MGRLMSGRWEDTTLSALERAPRYEMQMGLRYRASGETEWREAQIENISRSGVLFRVGESLRVSEFVEMRFMLPPGMAGKESAEILCQGWVVRSAPPSADEKLHRMAAKILEYRFVRDLGGCETLGVAQEQ